LRVTRRVYVERFARPVIVNSVYDRTSDVAQLNLYTGARDTAPLAGRPRGRFAIPEGTQLVAYLDQTLDTRNAREGDRFTLTVRSPGTYDGAVIEGRILEAERSGRITGRCGDDA
jgi:hypothetical protein